MARKPPAQAGGRCVCLSTVPMHTSSKKAQTQSALWVDSKVGGAKSAVAPPSAPVDSKQGGAVDQMVGAKPAGEASTIASPASPFTSPPTQAKHAANNPSAAGPGKLAGEGAKTRGLAAAVALEGLVADGGVGAAGSHGTASARSPSELYKEARRILEPIRKESFPAKKDGLPLPVRLVVAFKQLAYQANLGGAALKCLEVNEASVRLFPPETLPHLAELARKDSGVKISSPNLAVALCDGAIAACEKMTESDRQEALFEHALSVKVACLKDGTAAQKKKFAELPLFPAGLPAGSRAFYRYLVTLALDGRYTSFPERRKVADHLRARLQKTSPALAGKGRLDTLAALKKLDA